MGPESQSGSEAELYRYEALLQMADLVVRHQAEEDLLSEMATRFHQVAGFEVAGCCLHDAARNVMQLRTWEWGKASPSIVELPVEDTTAGWVWQKQKSIASPDIQSDRRLLPGASTLHGKGLRSFCELPLTTTKRRFGTLSFASPQVGLYGEGTLRLLERIAQLVAMALENALTASALKKEKERLQMLLEVNAALVANTEIPQIFPILSGFIRNILNHDHASIAVFDTATQTLNKYASDSSWADKLVVVKCLKDSAAGRALLEKEVKVYTHEDLQTIPSENAKHLLEIGIRSLVCIPMITGKGPIGTFNLASRRERAFPHHELELLKQIASQLGIAIENANAFREIDQLKDRLTGEKKYLEGEIHSELNFEEIIGESSALRHTLEQAKTVAPSEATVLILGETGTGKELIARAIHRMSGRKDANFIKLNCAAIPTGLLESELFGHEKGAFTGAVSQKIGRMELANNGTLLLDEVGDIPLEIQPKLLRVLQDREFERLGGTKTIHVNVRLLAATNHNLAARVEERKFRSDLFYRLNVFPVHTPSLRERKDDIALLARYFVQKFARKMNKQIENIPTQTLRALGNWSWPGNIRELENFIERSVILSNGLTLNAPLSELSEPVPEHPHNTLEAIERDHILRVLRETGGVIAGPQGAATRLGVKRTTLQSMISRFGISREQYHN
jgi:formate hydrogenlyase transcriptional activator